MAKEILIKIIASFMSCGILGIFASEKQFLLRNLAEKFSLQPTFFLRFFHKGFSEWELIGV